jgi:hypothetical protein
MKTTVMTVRVGTGLDGLTCLECHFSSHVRATAAGYQKSWKFCPGCGAEIVRFETEGARTIAVNVIEPTRKIQKVFVQVTEA